MSFDRANLFFRNPLIGRPVLVALVAASLSHTVPAETGASIEEVIVSMPIHRHTEQQLQPVAVLSGEQLRREVEATLGETIAKLPGVNSASFGPGVGQPVIRGLGGPRVSNLRNGLTTGDVSSVSPDHAVSVEPVLARSIEVLRGPATLLHGSGAIGGVVNVIDKRVPTRAVETVEAIVDLRHGSAADTQSYAGSLDVGVGSTVLHIDGVDRRSNDLEVPGAAIDGASPFNTDGYIENSNTRFQSRGFGLSQVFDAGYVGIAVSGADSNYGVPPDADELDEGESVRIDSSEERIELRSGIEFGSGLVETLRLFASSNEYEHSELEITPAETEVGTQFSNDSDNLRIELVHDEVSGLHGAFGVQAGQRELSVIGEEAYLPAVEHDSRALFLVETLQFNATEFQLGVRVERNELTGTASAGTIRKVFTTDNYSLGLLQPLSDNWKLAIALGRSERAPALEELFSNLGNDNDGSGGNDLVEHVATKLVERGNTGLRPERATSTDLSLRYAADDTELEITAFYNDFDRYIALLDSGETEVNEGTAIFDYRATGARFYGAELNFLRPLGELADGELAWRGSADWVEAKRSGGEDLPRLPPARIQSALQLDKANIVAELSALHALSRSGAAGEGRTAAYTRWDLDVAWTVATGSDLALTLFAKAKNLSDEEIRHSTSFLRDIAPASGRSLQMGLRAEL